MVRRCPECLALNAPSAVTCKKCGALLRPRIRGPASETKETNHAKETNSFRDIRVHRRVLMDKVDLLYKHIHEAFNDQALTREDLYLLLRAELGAGNPSKLVYVPKDFEWDPRKLGYVLQPLAREDYGYLEDNIPHPYVANKIKAIVSAHGLNIPEKVAFEEYWLRLLSELRRIDESGEGANLLLFKAGVQIRDEELEKVLGWEWDDYVDQLLYMEAKKDARIVLVAKANMIPQFPEMAKKNSMSIVITNSGTSKSVTFSRFGEIVTRTTAKSITGGAQSNGKVVESFLMRRRYPVIIEHLEAKAEESLLTYLITAISGLPSMIVVWQREREFKPYCALIINGNPNREKGQPNFEVFFTYLQGISANYVALGRRIGIIAYGGDYETVEASRDIDTIPWVKRAWVVWKEIVRRIMPLVKEIYSDGEVTSWINQPDEAYRKDVESVFAGEVEYVAVKDFFLEHGKNAYPAIKWRALSCALVDYGQGLLRLTLKGEGVTPDLTAEILGTTKTYYQEIKTLNYESIKQIAETTKLDERIAQMVYKNLPRYLKEFLITVGNFAVDPERAKGEFTIEELVEVFDEIKGEIQHEGGKPLYQGFSVVIQSFDRYAPHVKYGSKLRSLGVNVSKPAGVWIIRLNPPLLKTFVSLLSALSLLSPRHTPLLPRSLFYEEEGGKHGQELVNALRAQFNAGTRQEFEELAMELGNLKQHEAETLFESLRDEGSLLMDENGFWRWKK